MQNKSTDSCRDIRQGGLHKQQGQRAQERSEHSNRSQCPAGANVPATHMGTDDGGEYAVRQRMGPFGATE